MNLQAKRVVGVALVVMAGVVVTAGARVAAQGPRAAADGVFTAAQASRGEEVYQRACATCHMPDLRGESFAPALNEGAFSVRWKGKAVGELFAIMKGTMPADSPASLKDPEYADIIAFLLKQNGYPAGEQELAPDVAALKQVMFKQS